ncbi:MAG: YidH family protein [Cellulomonas sp.]
MTVDHESLDRGGRRRPRAVYDVGTEPDTRFSLANERTALSWVRTGLALVAGGVALTSAATFAGLPVLIDIMAIVACASGGLLALSGLASWRRVERSLRLDLPLPAPTMLPVLAIGVFLGALALAGFAIYQSVGR